MENKRIVVYDLEPDALKAMMAMQNYADQTDLDPKLKELIKIRASQINGCAYCLDMHTEEALRLGETERRIIAVSVWHESHLFSEEERALLKFTEEVTRISDGGVSDETYNRVVKFFGEKVTAQIIMQIVVINSWNRVNVATGRQIFKP
ncbi:MAG: carboxymuconolactone decarboxylase family protein [Ignavibacteriaceae bacterium]|jgi:alkylhydroperoxidase AhpD family core domain|nr:MAG: carboxymuconolactone decarboxylase family protein [Chlorobiota bacterium]KXK04607.1 MAG: Carboxymuconolactone decarboxylase family protein [Chlorobi bacterium OLB4]MBV6399529.1 hypothetical protein [Ignavibacteria bacterium]MCC6886627.1 carboxymuconolactone decarboxylase family protein [Ignavibacteriales bacterium]MCE7953234.1 carboxymuconolactone decarboxylase family protein [Chlorobi bacterium CHB7]MEB2328983.1 carboxymuconolactone decarboxylase family protein [Ignavibacteriaceae bac